MQKESLAQVDLTGENKMCELATADEFARCWLLRRNNGRRESHLR
jgi:hypothetical protein